MKPMMINAFAPITKTEKADDGSLLVYGIATNPQLDLDGQICDGDWLKQAMPEWFATGANIREMHQPSAVGVGTELEQIGDDHWLTAKIVDPVAIKKVDAGVYTGFSIGIRRPIIVKDAAAPNGRICGGDIIETSLADRPCNTTAKFMLTKMVAGTLTKVDPASTEVIAGNVDGADEAAADVIEEAAEESIVDQIRSLLTAWLASEAAEVAAGEGGTFVVQLILDMICDLNWTEIEDRWDDIEQAGSAMKAALTQETAMNLTLADVVKAVTADDVSADAVADLRKALVGDLAEQITKEAMKVIEPLKETVTGLVAEVTKIGQTVSNDGPQRARLVDPALTAEQAQVATKVLQLRWQADQATDRKKAASFRAYADQLELTLKGASQ